MTETTTFLQVMGALIIAFVYAAYKLYVKPYPAEPTEAPVSPVETPPSPSPIPHETPVVEATAPQPLLWDTPQQAFHSTRVLCDEIGLSYDQKDIVCACIYQESQFLNTAVGKNWARNKDGSYRLDKDGRKILLSTDWGIVQVNDTPGWHIGKGHRFSSVQDVLANPERAVRWMISVMKTTGKLQPWSSYTSKAYQQFLPKTSKMWKLKV